MKPRRGPRGDGRHGRTLALRRALPLVVALALAAGRSPARAGGDRSAAAPPKLETLSWGSVDRMHRFGDLYLASQPGKEDLALARDAGVKTVIDLRKPGELDWDERAEVQKLGMEYDNFGFKEPEELTDAILDGARRVLADAEKRPILLHCSSANRVGAVWLAYRVLDDGASFDEAAREAEEVGLKSAAFQERVKTYLERRRPR